MWDGFRSVGTRDSDPVTQLLPMHTSERRTAWDGGGPWGRATRAGLAGAEPRTPSSPLREGAGNGESRGGGQPLGVRISPVIRVQGCSRDQRRTESAGDKRTSDRSRPVFPDSQISKDRVSCSGVLRGAGVRATAQWPLPTPCSGQTRSPPAEQTPSGVHFAPPPEASPSQPGGTKTEHLTTATVCGGLASPATAGFGSPGTWRQRPLRLSSGGRFCLPLVTNRAACRSRGHRQGP